MRSAADRAAVAVAVLDRVPVMTGDRRFRVRS